MLEFCDKLKSFRLSRREFQNSTEFYKSLGVSQATGSRYESGDTEPPYSFLVKLSEKFGKDAAHLMPGGVQEMLLGEKQEAYSASGMTAGESAQRASAIIREVKAAAPRLREVLSDEDWDFVLGGVTQILNVVPRPEVGDSLRQLLLVVVRSMEKKGKKVPGNGGRAV